MWVAVNWAFSLHLHCIEVQAETSETDDWKPEQITPKLTWWLNNKCFFTG